jgi:signal peptidase I
MTDATTTTVHPFRRRPRVAMLLSLLNPGLGHLYCGVFGRGILLVFANMVLATVGIFAILPIESSLRTAGLIALALGIILWLYAMWDAPRVAKRTNPDYTLKDYNRWYVYLLLVSMLSPVGIASGMYIRAGVMEAFIIPSPSMYPTISVGERVLANKLAYREGPVRRGDMAVFPNPNNRSQANIKRVVALPGDTVEIKDGKVWINDKELAMELVGPSPAESNKDLSGQVCRETNGLARYLVLLAPPMATTAPTSTGPSVIPGDLAKTRVPNGHCFVLGDNRNRSLDSRQYGPIPLVDLVGRVEYVYWPRWENLRK